MTPEETEAMRSRRPVPTGLIPAVRDVAGDPAKVRRLCARVDDAALLRLIGCSWAPAIARALRHEATRRGIL